MASIREVAFLYGMLAYQPSTWQQPNEKRLRYAKKEWIPDQLSTAVGIVWNDGSVGRVLGLNRLSK